MASAFDMALPGVGGYIVALCAFLFGYTTLIYATLSIADDPGWWHYHPSAILRHADLDLVIVISPMSGVAGWRPGFYSAARRYSW